MAKLSGMNLKQLILKANEIQGYDQAGLGMYK